MVFAHYQTDKIKYWCYIRNMTIKKKNVLHYFKDASSTNIINLYNLLLDNFKVMSILKTFFIFLKNSLLCN